MKPFFILLFVISISLSFTSAQIITIAEAIEDLNGDFIPDRLGDTVTVQGVVYSPNYGGYYTNYWIDDGTAGTHFFYPPDIILNFNLGDKVQITGLVDQYYGSSEIAGLDTTSITLMSTGNLLPEPIVLTLAQYLADPEAYEGSLIGFISLTLVGGTWPSPGNNATVQISDGINTLNMFIDKDTDIDDGPEPTWPKDIIGIGEQYSTSTPPNDGYQLLPRFYSDFLPPGTLTQNSLTHNTGTLEVTVIDNGYIGDDTTHTYGGVEFNGNQNALFIAGFIFGQYGQGYGNMYRLMADFYNDIPIAGFDSTNFFNQHAYYTLAFTWDLDYRTMIESFSNTGHDFVFLRANISNNIMNIDDLYPGIFADWDVGNSGLNRGGYDPSRNLFYTYESGGFNDTSFYGIMGITIDGVPMDPYRMKGIITDSVAWNRIDLYNFMTSTVYDTITTDGDYRMFVCAGPFSITVGDTLVVDMAIVAGTSLADLLANADEAKSYWQFVLPVETETNNYFTFNLSQNYPNPFNPTTKIKYQIPELSFVTIKVYDVLGSEITTLVNEEKPVGNYEVEFNASILPSG
ncbi:MAG: hypothetical protein OQK57_01260, partial [Ignavibacteriaceae bacterium]|nr:hypothetical protein [Ignavibacteriaceae bacterium]